MKFTYLLIDFFAVLVPFVCSFHPRLSFYKTWRAFFPAVIITGILFLVWDAYFTQRGIWGFNPDYVLGYYLGNLPVEEVLFFLCIPYSCVFSYFCFDFALKATWSGRGGHLLTNFLIFVFIIIALTSLNKAYTAFTFTGLALALFTVRHLFKVNYLGKFYITYAVLLVPFLIVNGLLTGTGLSKPVVWYNNAQTLGIRILTIPVEDIFYGMTLILLNVSLYNYFKLKTTSPAQAGI